VRKNAYGTSPSYWRLDLSVHARGATRACSAPLVCHPHPASSGAAEDDAASGLEGWTHLAGERRYALDVLDYSRAQAQARIRLDRPKRRPKDKPASAQTLIAEPSHEEGYTPRGRAAMIRLDPLPPSRGESGGTHILTSVTSRTSHESRLKK
jgi:hypothetical protein